MSELESDLQPRDITCVDCGEVFTFTVGEQQYYKGLNFTNDPKRCKPCREARKQNKESKSKAKKK